MENAPAASGAFSPWDEHLALLPGALSPHLQAALVRLAANVPYRQAAALLGQLLRVSVSEATTRRAATRTGGAAVAASLAEQQRLEQEATRATARPEKLLLSTDGAMVPLVGGEWAEVRTLVIGAVGEPKENGPSGPRVPCTDLSYFSRLLPSEEFVTAAYPEIHRRGVENARAVAAVNDGAEWCQTFVQFHRPDARRILDFAHAAQRVAESLRLHHGEGPRTQARRAMVLQHLQKRSCRRPLRLMEGIAARQADDGRLQENAAYLRKREAQLDYSTFRREGWPIGSGCVESANKLVVEARLKGPGMHWARHNVNGMLALRNAECSGRWDETWAAASACRRRKRRQKPASLAQVAPATKSPTPPAQEPEPPRPQKKLLPKQTTHPWRRDNPGYLSRSRAKV